MKKVRANLLKTCKTLKILAFVCPFFGLILFSLLGSITGRFFLLAMLFWPFVIIYISFWLGDALINLMSYRWIEFLKSLLAYPIYGVILFYLFPSIVRSGDYIHVALFSPYYLAKIYYLNTANVDPVVFSWGDTAQWAGDVPIYKSLVFDRSGAYAAYAEKAKKGESRRVGDAGYDTVKLFGNFYLQYSWYAGSG